MVENYAVPNPRTLDVNGTTITKPAVRSGPLPIDSVLDRDWARISFLMSDTAIANSNDISELDQATKDDIYNRYNSSAARKFTDTRMGGGVACNNRPQFTPYSDIRSKGRLAGRANVTKEMGGNYGMGRYYSEAIDDNGQTIYLRFGVPQYNSLWSYFTNAYNPHVASVTLTGRSQGVLYTAGEVMGTFFTIAAFPVLSLTIMGTKMVGQFFNRSTSKFYTMKPTMHLYWSAVDMLVNSIVINRGLMPKFFAEGTITSQRIGDPSGVDGDYITELHTLAPRIFDEYGRVDIAAVALRAQSIANKLFLQEYEALKTGDNESFKGYVRKDGQETKSTLMVNDNGTHTLGAILANAAQAVLWYGTDPSDKPNLSEPSLKAIDSKGKPVEGLNEDQSVSENKEPGWFNQYREYMAAELADGAAFAVFKVDNTGPSSESFSNSVMESDISQKINQASSTARQVQFSLSGGNLGDGMIASAIEGVLGGVKDIATGALSGLTLGLSESLEAALAGVYFDIPKTWQSSSASLPRASYTIQLISPYGHPISQLQNIYIPLSMLLAGALPRSTGKQTYGPPFLCQVYDRGHNQIQLGMIESLSISRGTSNLNYTNKGQAMAIDVSFSIVDMSSIMHMPISTGGLWDFIKGIATGSLHKNNPAMDEDNILMDYLAVISGMDIYNQFYKIPRARLQAARALMQARKYSSPAWAAMAMHDQATSGTLAWLSLGTLPLTSAILEGMSSPAGVIGDRMEGR